MANSVESRVIRSKQAMERAEMVQEAGQDVPEINGEEVASRIIERINPAIANKQAPPMQRTQALKRIRPMLAVNRCEGAKTDYRYKQIPPAVQFSVEQQKGPEGDERAILDTDPSAYEFEKITDHNGNVTLRRRSPAEVEEAVRISLFSRAFRDEHLSLDDLTPHRIRAAYRIVRELARLKNLVLPDETLAEALRGDKKNVDPWAVPERWELTANKRLAADMWPECIDMIVASERIPVEDQVHRWDFEKNIDVPHPGVGLLPPPVPPRWLTDDGQVVEAYNPDLDLGLRNYVNIIGAVSKRLYIEQGTEFDPHTGRYGLIGLLNLDMCRLCFPTRLQIITWEQVLIEETLELLVSSSIVNTRKTLNRRYGFVSNEIQVLVRLANQLAVRLTEGDIENARGLMVLRLEEYMRRAKDGLDLRAEMSALKQLTIVQGLSAEQPDDFLAKMIDSVRAIGQERRQGPKILPPLPPRKLVENTATAPVYKGP